MTEKRYHILDRALALTTSELRGSLRDTPLEMGEVILLETTYPNKNVTIEFMAEDTPEDYPDDPIIDRNGNTSPFKVGDKIKTNRTDRHLIVGEEYQVRDVYLDTCFEWAVIISAPNLGRRCYYASIFHKADEPNTDEQDYVVTGKLLFGNATDRIPEEVGDERRYFPIDPSLGSVTGRIHHNKPEIQDLDNELTMAISDIFDPHEIIVDLDWADVEQRIADYLSKPPVIFGVMNNPLDMKYNSTGDAWDPQAVSRHDHAPITESSFFNDKNVTVLPSKFDDPDFQKGKNDEPDNTPDDDFDWPRRPVGPPLRGSTKICSQFSYVDTGEPVDGGIDITDIDNDIIQLTDLWVDGKRQGFHIDGDTLYYWVLGEIDSAQDANTMKLDELFDPRKVGAVEADVDTIIDDPWDWDFEVSDGSPESWGVGDDDPIIEASQEKRPEHDPDLPSYTVEIDGERYTGLQITELRLEGEQQQFEVDIAEGVVWYWSDQNAEQRVSLRDVLMTIVENIRENTNPCAEIESGIWIGEGGGYRKPENKPSKYRK